MSRCFPRKILNRQLSRKKKTNERKTDFPGSRKKFFSTVFFFLLQMCCWKNQPSNTIVANNFFFFRRRTFQNSINSFSSHNEIIIESYNFFPFQLLPTIVTLTFQGLKISHTTNRANKRK